jgi:prohibitin 2
VNKFQLCLIVLLAGCLGGCGFEVVDTGHRGCLTRFGAVTVEPLAEGFQTYNPFTQNVVELNVQTNKFTADMETYTQDVQQAKLKMTINYNLMPSATCTTYRDIGREWDDKLIPQVVAGALKEVIGKWTAENLIANRDRAATEAMENIKTQLALVSVNVSGFEINDISYEDEFERAVEAKVVAVQKAHAEKNKTVQIEEQAKQTIASAQAEAESMRIRARALESNPKLVEYEAVQKWNGILPTMMMGNAVPFINIK